MRIIKLDIAFIHVQVLTMYTLVKLAQCRFINVEI